MIHTNLFTAGESREKLMSGIKRVATAIGATMGTSGANVLIEALERPGYLSTNDGYTAANSIYFEDPLEDLGKKILLEAINRANRASGDGSSTTAVLCAAILEEGIKHLGEASPMEIKRSLEECIPIIEESINAQKKEITVNDVAQVASISAEDEEIGNRIQEIYKQIGPKGIINWDVSKTPEDSYSIGSGLTINGATYVSRYMCDLNEGGVLTRATMVNPTILLLKKRITSTTDLDPIFDKLFNSEVKEVAIFCEDMEPPVVNSIVLARQKIGFRAVVIKMPVIWADEWWEDLSLATGATVIDAISGIKTKNITLEHLGTAEHLTVDREDTYLEGIKDLSQHILSLQADGSDQMLQRAQRLNTRTARYFVGGHSESGLAYRRLKVEDAINAASCALDNGVVPGGGIALLNASHSFVADKKSDKVGHKILKKALIAPLETIMINAGTSINTTEGFDGVYFSNSANNGFNSRTGKVVDMFKAGIVDPTDVVLNSIRNAIGVAAAVLTTSTVILLPRDDSTSPPQNGILQR